MKRRSIAELVDKRRLVELPPLERGEVLQSLFSEFYPTLRWNFSWGLPMVTSLRRR
ncbi:MAG: hypothetical protein QXY49_05645 [Thermofilaceae archaeon]